MGEERGHGRWHRDVRDAMTFDRVEESDAVERGTVTTVAPTVNGTRSPAVMPRMWNHGATRA